MNDEIKKRAMNALSSLNITMFCTLTQNTKTKLASLKQNEIRTRDAIKERITTYDNYDFVNHRFAKRIDNWKKQRDIITAV